MVNQYETILNVIQIFLIINNLYILLEYIPSTSVFAKAIFPYFIFTITVITAIVRCYITCKKYKNRIVPNPNNDPA